MRGRPALSLADAFKPGFLGRCGGRRPWLDSIENGCQENLHFLSRSATNTYFAQTVTVISLPIHEDALGAAIRKHWSALQNATDIGFVGVIRNVPEIGATLQSHSDADVFGRIQQMRERDQHASVLHPKIKEFDLLSSGLAVIGRDAENEPLFAETLSGIDRFSTACERSPGMRSSTALWPCTACGRLPASTASRGSSRRRR